MKKIIILTLLGIYPFLLAGVCLVVYQKHKNSKDLQQQLQDIPESSEAEQRQARLQRKYKEQNEQITKLLSTFYQKTKDFTEVDVPALLKKYASQAGVSFEALEADTKIIKENCLILPVSFKISGEFNRLLSFLKRVEEDPHRFMSFTSIKHQSSMRKYVIRPEWRTEIEVVLDGPEKKHGLSNKPGTKAN